MYSSWWQFQLPTANPGGSWFALFASHWPIRDTWTSRPCLSVTGGCIWMPSCFKCPFHDMSFGLFFWGIKSNMTFFFSRIFLQRSLKLLTWILQNGGFFRKWILRLQKYGVLLESRNHLTGSRYLFIKFQGVYTPWKINMEPTNQPLQINQISMIMFHVNLQEGWSNFEPSLHLEREMLQFDLRISFNWVGSTTNQLSIQFYLAPPSTKKNRVPLLVTIIFKVWNH